MVALLAGGSASVHVPTPTVAPAASDPVASDPVARPVALPAAAPARPVEDLVPPPVTAVVKALQSTLGLDAPVAPRPEVAPPPPVPEAVPAPVMPAVPPGDGPAPSGEVIAAPAPAPAAAPASMVATTAPERCSGITVTKRAEPTLVEPGQEFTWVLVVANPNAAELSRATVVDTVAASPGITYTIVYTDPVADSSTASSVTFDDIGPIGAGRSETIRIRVRVEPGSAGGRFTGSAVVTGDCAPEREIEGAVPVEGRARIDLPDVSAVLGAVTRREAAGIGPGQLSRTGGPGWGPTAVALLAGSFALHRLVRAAGPPARRRGR